LKFHPAVQILTWCLLVAILQWLAPAVVLAVTGVILLCAFALAQHKLRQMLRRTRWILLTLMLIYAYATPGQAALDSLGMLSPSYEGLVDGILQLARLLAALAALALLLDRLHRQQLIAGLYSLFAPLRWFGLSRERLAVRLALTLHYAEVVMLRSHSWQDTLRSLFEPHDETTRALELPLYRFGLADALLLCGALLLLWLTLQ